MFYVLCFDVLNDFVDEHNNTYHRTLKMKPIDVKSSLVFMLNTMLILMKKILNLK